MKSIRVALVALAASLLVVSCAQQNNTGISNASNAIKPVNAATPAPTATAAKDEMAIASELYTVNCMTCHKDSGKGGPVTVDGKKLDPDDLTAEKFKKMSDEKLIGYVRDGIVDEGMPAFKGTLTEAEMAAGVGHVRKLQSR